MPRPSRISALSPAARRVLDEMLAQGSSLRRIAERLRELGEPVSLATLSRCRARRAPDAPAASRPKLAPGNPDVNAALLERGLYHVATALQETLQREPLEALPLLAAAAKTQHALALAAKARASCQVPVAAPLRIRVEFVAPPLPNPERGEEEENGNADHAEKPGRAAQAGGIDSP